MLETAGTVTNPAMTNPVCVSVMRVNAQDSVDAVNRAAYSASDNRPDGTGVSIARRCSMRRALRNALRMRRNGREQGNG